MAIRPTFDDRTTAARALRGHKPALTAVAELIAELRDGYTTLLGNLRTDLASAEARAQRLEAELTEAREAAAVKLGQAQRMNPDHEELRRQLRQARQERDEHLTRADRLEAELTEAREAAAARIVELEDQVANAQAAHASGRRIIEAQGRRIATLNAVLEGRARAPRVVLGNVDATPEALEAELKANAHRLTVLPQDDDQETIASLRAELDEARTEAHRLRRQLNNAATATLLDAEYRAKAAKLTTDQPLTAGPWHSVGTINSDAGNLGEDLDAIQANAARTNAALREQNVELSRMIGRTREVLRLERIARARAERKIAKAQRKRAGVERALEAERKARQDERKAANTYALGLAAEVDKAKATAKEAGHRDGLRAAATLLQHIAEHPVDLEVSINVEEAPVGSWSGQPILRPHGTELVIKGRRA